MTKKLGFPLLLALCLSVLLLSFAMAETKTGTCGRNVTWTLDEDGLLTISGTGSMEDYSFMTYPGRLTTAPWRESPVQVTIENGVTSIGTYAFYYCPNLVSAEIPEGITTIKYATFAGCGSLADVTIPEGVISIEEIAFKDCGSLPTVTLPNSLTTIGIDAFKNCSSLTKVTLSESLTRIAGGAFENCAELTSVTIPKSVIAIGNNAFGGCGKLTLYGVAGSFAQTYANANSIPFVVIEDPDAADFVVVDGVITGYTGKESNLFIPSQIGGKTMIGIGTDAFKDSGLTDVTIPSTITSIVDRAFDGCDSLTIHAAPGSAAQAYAKSNGIAFEPLDDLEAANYSVKDGLITGYTGEITELVIPSKIYGEAIIGIGSSAFSWSEITSITIPEGVTSIGSSAFSYCRSLVSVTLPSTLTTIGHYAFYDCYYLPSIVIPEGVEKIQSEAFLHCDRLTNVTLPDSLVSIGSCAFECTSLTEITIPKGVATIESQAFANTKMIAYHVAPDNQNFCDVDGVVFSKDKTKLIIYPEARTDTDYQIPDGVTTIDSEAFYGCKKLINIILPASVTTIDFFAFHGCSALTTITIPESVSTINQNAFQDCKSLTIFCYKNSCAHSFASKNNIPYILLDDDTPASQFTFSTSGGKKGYILKYFGTAADVVIPEQINGEDVVGLDEAAFKGTAVTSVVLPAAVRNVGRYCFQNCASLTNISLNNQVIGIYKYTFDGCTQLASIVLPDSVTSVGDFAFQNCVSMTSIVIPDSVTSISESAFIGCANLTIYGIRGSFAETYAKGNNIPFKVFSNCEHTWSEMNVTLSPTETEAGTAVSVCSLCGEEETVEIPALKDMKTLRLPSGLTAIEEEAFAGLTVEAVIIPDGCTSIGNSAFAGCASLIYVRVHNGAMIPEDAFADCPAGLIVDRVE